MKGQALAVYVRVSSSDQSSRSQMAELACEAKAAPEEEVWWYEDKFTGTTMDRPEWNRLWWDVLKGKIARIVVWRLDRLGRTSSGMTALFDELKRLNVGLKSLKEGVDLTTPGGRLMCDIMASMAMYETSVRSERQRAGIDAAKAAGKAFGRPKGTGRAIKLTDERRALIVKLKSEGTAVASIARLTQLSRDSVYQVLASQP